MQSEPINILTIQFANEISQHEIQLFRGAVIHSMENKSILLHNHEGDNFRYSYPLIQYKQIKDKAAIICIGKGTESINDLFQLQSFPLQLGKNDVDMRIKSIHLDQVQIGCIEKERHYKLQKWLPLNSDNYEAYQDMENMVNKIQLLESILVGNILSLFKGLGIHVDQQISLHITDIPAQQIVNYKKVKLMAFDIEFKANVSLPQYIGIGKNVSIGYGTLTKKTR
jgi:hypothetical protein